MPLARFLVLNSKIPQIQAENDLHLLNVVFTANHPGDKGKGLKRFSNNLESTLLNEARHLQSTPIQPGLTPGVTGLESENASKLREEREQKIRDYEDKRKGINRDSL